MNYSPLRYPGGKQVLSRVLTRIIEINGASGGTYIEPYAGGAGAALTLLFEERVDRIVINDADYRIYAFWRAALSQTDAFVERLVDHSTRMFYEGAGRKPSRHASR